jgi:glycogen operon protein
VQEGRVGVEAVRAARQRRNLIATLMLSAGVPMLSGGDEIVRTQFGNNNAYCQDNEISWTSWPSTPEQREMLHFTQRVIKIWKEHPVLRRRKFFQGRRIRGAEVVDIAWLDPAGAEMTDQMWGSPDERVLGVRLNGDAIQEVNERGERVTGASLLLMFNAGPQPVSFVLPAISAWERWATLLDTADPWALPRRLSAGERYELQARSMAALELNVYREDRRSPDWGPQGVL